MGLRLEPREEGELGDEDGAHKTKRRVASRPVVGT